MQGSSQRSDGGGGGGGGSGEMESLKKAFLLLFSYGKDVKKKK